MSSGTDADDEAGARRLAAVVQALQVASLDSMAGAWIDHSAGRVLHVLLADPSTTDEQTVRAITAGTATVIDPVAIPGRDLDDLQDRVLAQLRCDTELEAAFISSGIDVRANLVAVVLREGTDPAVAERLLASTGRRGVEVGYSATEWYAG